VGVKDSDDNTIEDNSHNNTIEDDNLDDINGDYSEDEKDREENIVQ